ncbi:glycoside hydrolase family 97 protein [Flavobacterium algicola]|uniref:glycoside hydrolase family 97 protein n=1 Tax=Flavobacterium algicola TaxID=556529 RepID=UPI001EFD97A5|nr:glycoside hydrolase family 97 protein [Flavobacterium algicola]MCG9792299.1 glycoside hydrolase family 97 protein [Flavobacterium algicola]
MMTNQKKTQLLSSKFTLLLLMLLVAATAFATKKKNYTVKSPEGELTVVINNENDVVSYKLLKNGQELIGSSEISILANGVTAKITGCKNNSENKDWKPVWGQFSEIKNKYNELVLSIKLSEGKAKLYVRAYNNGFGFRYELEGIQKGTEARFYCEYNLNTNDVLYCPAGENVPLGPLSFPDFETKKVLPKLMMPLVVEHSEKSFLSLLESDLFVAPDFGVIKFSYDKDKKRIVAITTIKLTDKKLTTPWRVILVNDNVGDLVTNTVPLNLATENQIKDTSWIKPGKTLWDWRVHDYKTVDGFTYGNNTESYERFIDFAAKKGIEYFLIDANWYDKVSKGHFEVTSGLDLEKVSKYASDKGVKLILYYDRHKGDYGDETLFSYFESLGMSGIKYGFMGSNVSFTLDAISQSANNHLVVDFHDSPVPFTGIERTLPNAITKEYCHAQQDSRKAFTPESFIRMALINAIQGPLDMNNGNFDIVGINKGERQRGPKQLNSYFSTVVSESARTLIIYSGLVCIPDAPEAYEKKADLFEFIEKLPVGKWDESKVLHAEMDQYISTARRHGKEWFVGSVANQEGKTLDIKLDFLEEGKTYDVTYYEDAKDTHGLKNPETYQIRKGKVNKGTIIKAIMAPSGGHCMWIKPE